MNGISSPYCLTFNYENGNVSLKNKLDKTNWKVYHKNAFKNSVACWLRRHKELTQNPRIHVPSWAQRHMSVVPAGGRVGAVTETRDSWTSASQAKQMTCGLSERPSQKTKTGSCVVWMRTPLPDVKTWSLGYGTTMHTSP